MNVANAYQAKRHYFDGKSLYLHNPKENISISENLLRMLRKDKSYTQEEAKLLDLLLMVCAEHGGGDPEYPDGRPDRVGTGDHRLACSSVSHMLCLYGDRLCGWAESQRNIGIYPADLHHGAGLSHGAVQPGAGLSESYCPGRR